MENNKRIFVLNSLSVEEKSELVHILKNDDGNFDIMRSNRILVDGKSIMGVIHMDMSHKDAELICYGAHEETLKDIKKVVLMEN